MESEPCPRSDCSRLRKVLERYDENLIALLEAKNNEIRSLRKENIRLTEKLISLNQSIEDERLNYLRMVSLLKKDFSIRKNMILKKEDPVVSFVFPPLKKNLRI